MMNRIVKVLCLSVVGLCMLFLLACTVRVFVCDRFVIKGESMSPTYESGEAVWVNKLLMGARIYTDYDFDSTELHAFRMPGFRNAEVGDVVIFNYPFGHGHHRIEFRINYVYAKRILGCPGDTIGIRDGYYYNERHDAGSFGVPERQELLSHTPDSLLGYSPNAFPLSLDIGWTVYNSGPMTVPAKGMTVELDELNTILYSLVIRYETGHKPRWDGTRCLIDGKAVESYTFTGDYYYLVGDNVLNSKDSRFFGFVPELYIIGVIG